MTVRPRAGRAVLMASLATAAVFTVAACGSSSSGTSGSASGSAAQGDPAAVLRYVYQNAPSTLDPHVVNTGFANVPLFLIFDRLVHVNPAGEAIPGLATSWKFSDDGKSLTLKLREGVKFQDGTPFDAEAVKMNIEHGKTVEASFVKTDLDSIEKVTVVDPLTVRLALKSPDVGLVLKLSDRAGAMLSPKSIEAGTAGTKPVGAGMYQLDGDYQVGVKMKVKKWDGYWNAKAQTLGGVEMTFAADPAVALNSVKSGGADAGLITPAQIDPAKSAGLNVLESYDLGYRNIFLNGDNLPALKDEKVRLALNLAIDRQEFVNGLLFGYGKVNNQPFPAGYFAHSDKAPQYAYDPTKAKQLLDEAGYANGFDITLETVPGNFAREAEAIAAQWGKIGVKVKVSQLEAAALGVRISVDKTAQAAFLNWTGRPDPSSTLSLLYFEGGTQGPAAKMITPKAQSLFDEQDGEADPAKRAQLLQGLSEEFVAHPPASQIVVANAVNATVTTKKVVGLQEWTTGKTEFGGVQIVK